MRISVILAHPDHRSFNHAIADEVRGRLTESGHDVRFHDLCQEDFDPILPAAEIASDAKIPETIRIHCEEIASADGIVIVHPNWWGQPPAILKGWVDRVIRPDVAYKFLEGDAGEGVPVGLLKAKTAVVFNTSNTPMKREEAVFGDPLERLWKNCIFDLCGVKSFFRKMFTVVVTSTNEERQAWLNEAGEITDRCFPGDS